MISFLVRLLGLVLILTGMVVLLLDLYHSFHAGRLAFTPLGQSWYALDRESLNATQAIVQRYLHPYIWDPIVQTFLLWPTFLIAGIWGVIFLFVGAGRRR